MPRIFRLDAMPDVPLLQTRRGKTARHALTERTGAENTADTPRNTDTVSPKTLAGNAKGKISIPRAWAGKHAHTEILHHRHQQCHTAHFIVYCAYEGATTHSTGVVPS